MKAIVVNSYGSPEILGLKEVEKPIPKDNELLIKVRSATVNRTDCAILRGKPKIARIIYGISKPKKNITGTDFSGIVESIGKNVSKFKVGDKIFGFDDNGLMSHAEYLIISENNAIATIPENVSFEQATASIEGAHYAYNMINKIKLKLGDKVLVNGASGAIGSSAVQLLNHFGMEITAVCNTKNLELIKSIGANRVIDYTKEDFTRSNEKYRCIFDAIGKSSFGNCKPLLEKGGAYISTELGKMSQNLFYALLTLLFNSKKVLFPIPVDRLRSVLLIKSLMEKGRYEPVIDKTYSLENIKEAFAYVETGKKTGNVVVYIR